MAQQVLKNSLSDIRIFPLKEPQEPGSLGFQLDRKTKENKPKQKKHNEKQLSACLKIALKMP